MATLNQLSDCHNPCSIVPVQSALKFSGREDLRFVDVAVNLSSGREKRENLLR